MVSWDLKGLFNEDLLPLRVCEGEKNTLGQNIFLSLSLNLLKR